jgi:Predicted peptidase
LQQNTYLELSFNLKVKPKRHFMRLIYICIVLFFLLPVSLLAADTEAVEGKTAYPFLIHTPETSSVEKQPVFIFLHGRSLCGHNLERVKRYGVLYAMDKGTDVPGIVVAPQAPGGWDADKVMEVVDYVLKNNPNADESRIYVCGMSLGGYGTMEVAGKYPNRIAAAVAICGGGNILEAENLAKVPIELFHGTADRIVPISESRKIMKAIKNVDENANVTLTEIKGGTHGSVERLFHQPDIYEWLLQHTKSKS